MSVARRSRRRTARFGPAPAGGEARKPRPSGARANAVPRSSVATARRGWQRARQQHARGGAVAAPHPARARTVTVATPGARTARSRATPRGERTCRRGGQRMTASVSHASASWGRRIDDHCRPLRSRASNWSTAPRLCPSTQLCSQCAAITTLGLARPQLPLPQRMPACVSGLNAAINARPPRRPPPAGKLGTGTGSGAAASITAGHGRRSQPEDQPHAPRRRGRQEATKRQPRTPRRRGPLHRKEQLPEMLSVIQTLTICR